MPVKFKDSININNEYTLPLVDGDQGEALITDGAGNVSFGAASAASSGLVLLNVKNTSGAALSKGDPVHVTGNVGNSTRLEVDGADASDSTKMPAVGVLTQDLADNGEGTVTITGYLKDIDTTAIDGSNGGPGDVVYVKPGGGLTYTKPTGSNLIQNIAKVGRDHANGSLVVSSIMRTNDVPTPLYIDHANQRLGIGTTSPRSTLEVDGQVLISNTAPFLDFVDTNSFTDINDRFRVRAGGNQGLMQWYDSSSSSLLTLMTLNPNGDVIVPNGNFGIGTTSPSTKLHVYESSALNHVTIDGNNGDNRNLRFATEDSTRWNVYATGTSESGSNVGSDFTIARYADGGSYLGNPFIIKRNTGNVGIGTTAPEDLLHIDGGNIQVSTAASGEKSFAFFEESNGGTGATIGYDGNDNTLFIGTTADNNTNISKHIQVPRSTGYVGIGTASPVNPLHVQQGSSSFSFSEYNNGATLWLDGSNGDFTGGDYFNISANGTTDLAFGYGGVTKMLMKSNGNVGIGTTSPIVKLHTVGDLVAGTSGFTAGMNGFTGLSSYHSSTAVENIDSLYLRKGGTNGSSTSIAFASAGGDTYYVGSRIKHIRSNSNSKGHLVFETKGDTSQSTTTERMRITDAGNVGIGTTSPSTKLEIRKTLGTGLIISSNSTLRLVDTNSNLNAGQGAAISLAGAYNSSGTILDGAPYIRAAKTNSNDGDYGFGLQFGVRTNGAATPTSAMAISSSSQLKLNTYGSGTHTGTLSKMLAVDANGNVIETTSGSGTVDGTGTANYVPKWSDSNTLTNGLIYDTGSYIGVGTTTPNTKTHIRHTTKIDDGYGLLLVENTNTTTNSPVTNSGINVKNHHGTSQFMQWENHGLRIGSRILTNSGEGNVIFTSGSDFERMRITSGGDVSIGTTTVASGAKLTVAGNATITGTSPILKIDGSGHAGITLDRGSTSYDSNLMFATAGSIKWRLWNDGPDDTLQIRDEANSTNVMTWKTGGNVGIGTDDPRFLLDLAATGNQSNQADYIALGVRNGPSGGGGAALGSGLLWKVNFTGYTKNSAGIVQVAEGNFFRSGLAFYTNGTADQTTDYSERLRISSGGNVGIGATSPSKKLHVVGGSTPAALFDTTTDYNVGLSRSGVEEWWLKTYTDGRFAIHENGVGDQVTIKAGGNVGIGTTSPVSSWLSGFDPQTGNGNFRLTTEGWIVQPYNTGLAAYYPGQGARPILWTDASGTTIRSWDTNDSDGISLQSSNGTTRLFVQENGNVGIGTTTPSAKLEVANGAGKFSVDSKTHNVTNSFTTCLTVNLNSHTGCYVTLTCFGDWGSHSTAAYRGEFFLQNGGNGYNEPGVILRQDDNTSNGSDQIVCQILDPTGTGNPKDFEIQIRTTATTGTTSFAGTITYTVQGKFNSIT